MKSFPLGLLVLMRLRRIKLSDFGSIHVKPCANPQYGLIQSIHWADQRRILYYAATTSQKEQQVTFEHETLNFELCGIFSAVLICLENDSKGWRKKVMFRFNSQRFRRIREFSNSPISELSKELPVFE